MNKGRVRLARCVAWRVNLQVRMAMSDRVARKGPYPLYAENCMKYGIDDYAIEAGGTVMVSAIGQVVTSAGTLVAMLEPGRCSASEHVHALIPHDPRRRGLPVARHLDLAPRGRAASPAAPQLRPARRRRPHLHAHSLAVARAARRLRGQARGVRPGEGPPVRPGSRAVRQGRRGLRRAGGRSERRAHPRVRGLPLERGTDVPATLRANDKAGARRGPQRHPRPLRRGPERGAPRGRRPLGPSPSVPLRGRAEPPHRRDGLRYPGRLRRAAARAAVRPAATPACPIACA